MPYSLTDQAAGEVILHTDINELQQAIEDNARRGATLIVAAADAPQKSKDSADYVCDGTADQVEINAALLALPAFTTAIESGHLHSGSVMLTEGTYTISAAIDIFSDGVLFHGRGRATVISPVAGYTDTEVIRIDRPDDSDRPAHYVTLRDFTIDGKDRGTAVEGIFFRAAESWCDNVCVHDMTGSGIRVNGRLSPAWDTYRAAFSNLMLHHNAVHGLHAATSATDCWVCDSEIFENTQSGIAITGGAAWRVDDCMIWGNVGYAVRLEGGVGRFTLAASKLEQNGGGLQTVYTTTGPSDLIVVGNLFNANGPIGGTQNTTDDINLNGTGGSPYGAIIAHNMFIRSYTQQARYAINIPSSNGTRIVIESNHFGDGTTFGTGVINNTQTAANVRIRQNFGYTTEASGTGTITSAATSVVVTHGLAVTPAAQDISVTPTNSTTTDIGYWYITTLTSTQFTVNVRTAPGASTFTFGWQAQVVS